MTQVTGQVGAMTWRFFKRTSTALFALALALSILVPTLARASGDAKFVGNVTYTYVGGTAVLTVAQVENISSVSTGTLRLELWALPGPYTGAAVNGYKLAEYTLGVLVPGFSFFNVNSGDIAFTAPPDGTYTLVVELTEYVAGPFDDGYVVDDWVNYYPAVLFGPPAGPPPPALTPQVGLWWNPNESGSGYGLDYINGTLIVTTYSYRQDGSPQWYLSSGPLSGSTFTSTLDKYVGGQCISCAYNGRPTLIGNDGTVTIIFSSPTSATMYLPGGRVTAIQPEF
jgi:hypothetical protein